MACVGCSWDAAAPVLNAPLPYILGGAWMGGHPTTGVQSHKEESEVRVAPGYGPASELSTGLACVAAVKPTQ